MLRILTVVLAGCVFVGSASAVRAKEPKTIAISVTEKGFEPTPITVKKGEPLKLIVTRKTDKTCAKAIVFDDPKVKKELPLNEAVEISLTPSKTGELTYGCAMGKMVAGVLKVE